MQQSALIISSVSIGPCPTYDVDEVSTEELHYIDLSKWMPDNVCEDLMFPFFSTKLTNFTNCRWVALFTPHQDAILRAKHMIL